MEGGIQMICGLFAGWQKEPDCSWKAGQVENGGVGDGQEQGTISDENWG